MNVILCGLSESKFVKAIHCESLNKNWGKIQNIYEGKNNVKNINLQTHRSWFMCLKMKDEENGASYILHVDEIVNTVKEPKTNTNLYDYPIHNYVP